MVSSNRNTRVYLLGAILIFWGCVICLRLLYLQIFCYGEFEQRAQHQQQRTADVAAPRGVIYDRSGRELAMSTTVESVFAVPSDIPDLAGTISLISRITKDDPREVLARCQAAKTFCWLARKTDSDIADRIRSLNLRGIHFEKESKRFYPKSGLAAQVIGYVGIDDGGLSGIEREYDDELRGKAGRMLISVDARKKWFSSVENQPQPGEKVVVTVDQQIQYIAERELETAMQQTRAESGTVVVENPRTGEILALANRPTFNPNFSHAISPEDLKDHAVSDVYEPGSTFKLVTISAALDEKLTRPEETIDCQMGSIVVNGRRIHDWKPYGVLSVSDILAKSSDVGAIKLALRLGDERFYKYIRAFGFGQQTGVELPGETRGLAKPLNRWSKVSIAAISMGQEIGVSPLQLAAMVSTIANDGMWVSPRIVAANGELQGTTAVPFHPATERRVVTPLTAAQMKQMMQGVVLHGTGRKAILEGYSSAGKTGTAQKVDPATGTYSRTKYIASFAGFAPVNTPAITVVVILDSPINGHHGGEVGAPVFQRIAQQTLEYLHTPHDVELPASRQVLVAERQVKQQDVEEGSPDRLGDSLADGATSLPAAAASLPGATEVDEPSGGILPAALHEPAAVREKDPEPAPPVMAAVSTAEPTATQPIPSRGTVVLDVEPGGIVVPSFLGKSVRSAVEMAEQSGIDLDAVGSGLAQQQMPAPGAHVPAGATVTVKFGR